MDRPDYPWQYRVADVASTAAQRAHFVSLFVQLTTFFVVGVFSQVQAVLDPARPAAKWVTTVSAIILALGIIAVLVNRERKYDKRWFDARAVAESTKTLTWRFVMHVPPFDREQPDAKFIGELRAVAQTRPVPTIVHDLGSADQITPAIQAIRQAAFADRKPTYLNDRVEDQRAWYSRNARSNARQASLWFWATLALQAAALASVIAKAAGGLAFSPASLLMTLAAAGTAWSQAKRFEELSAAYSLAALELANLKSLLETAADESAFLLLVEDVEEAISREHTMWRARRNVAR